MNTLIITANVSPSACIDLPGARDVEVVVQIPGLDPIEGEVTIAPCQYDGKLEAYGCGPDNWLSGWLLCQLRDLCDRDFRAALDAIEAAAVAAVAAAEPVADVAGSRSFRQHHEVNS